MMKTIKKVIAVCGFVVLAVLMFACDTAPVSQTIHFNADFSGSRIIEIELSATPVTDPGNNNQDVTYPGLKGIPYYRIKMHGAALEAYLVAALEADSFTGEYDWTVEVDDSQIVIPSANPNYPLLADGKEIIRVSFEFDNFAEYTAKMRALASFGGASLQFSRDGNSYDYMDPELRVDVDAMTAHYFEQGANTRFLYAGIWTHMIDDPNMVKVGTSYHPDGTAFYVEKGNGRNDLLYDGVKGKSISLNANGSKRTLIGLTQADGTIEGIPGHTYYNIDMELSGSAVYKNFFTGPFTFEDNSVTYTGGNPEFRWYAADENGAPVGDPLTDAVTYTHTFDGDETPVRVVGVDGSAQYIKTLSVPQVQTWTVTFLDWDDEVLGTAVVEDGEDVPESAIPESPGMRDDGQVFKNWEGSLTNITQDTTVRAVYEEPDDGGNGDDTRRGCNSSLFTASGFVGGALLLVSALAVAKKRKD